MSLVLANPTAPLQPGITTTPRAQGGGGSNISDPHPDYIARRPDWVLCFDCNEGQRHIKSKTTTYLPATSGMRALGLNSGDEGLALYEAYLIRAFFPDLMKETVRALTGILVHLSLRDTSQEHKLSQQMRLSNKVLENTAEATMITDPECRIVMVNKAFSKITGFSFFDCSRGFRYLCG